MQLDLRLSKITKYTHDLSVDTPLLSSRAEGLKFYGNRNHPAKITRDEEHESTHVYIYVLGVALF